MKGETMKRIGMMALVVSVTAIAAIAVPATPAAPNGVVASATGSGHMIRNGFNRTFSFAATKRADGTVTGELELDSREFEVVVHIRIDCLRIEGNKAHMSGLITRSSNPAEGEVGEVNRLVVQDNGEGPKAPPDMISGIPANPGNADPATCETNPDRVPNRTVQRGNIQVRGG
jgi:hypothetical protein